MKRTFNQEDISGKILALDMVGLLGGKSGGSVTPQYIEKHINNSYTISDVSEYIIIENLTSDIVITLPDISTNPTLKTVNWKITRNDDSNYKVYVSLETPQDSSFGERFHVLELKEKGQGVQIYCSDVIPLYFYVDYSGILLESTIPIVNTNSANVSGTNLIMIGTVDNIGLNSSVNVYFRYRQEGTIIWSYTTPQIMITTGSFTDTANVVSGVKYEVQAILEDSKSVLYYGEIVLAAPWIDLRLGGDVFTDGNAPGNDIRYQSQMSMTRVSDGMYFTGRNPWSSWVKFESLGWTRGENKTLEWIFTRPSNSMMIGIGSDATDETDSSQYSQAEIEAYFSNSNNLWGLYGNTGIVGNYANQSINQSISGGTGVYKIKFTNDGTINQSIFSLYELPTANDTDWDDDSNLLTSVTNTNIGANEPNLMPFIIPRNGGTQRFIAIKIS